MKILAIVTPNAYGNTTYIAEIKASELQALHLLSTHDNPIVNRDGKIEKVDTYKLQPGDEISHEYISEAHTRVTSFLNSEKDIMAHMAALKGAMTKLQNSLPK